MPERIEVDVAHLRKLRLAGASCREIAELCGVSRSYVQRALQHDCPRPTGAREQALPPGAGALEDLSAE